MAVIAIPGYEPLFLAPWSLTQLLLRAMDALGSAIEVRSQLEAALAIGDLDLNLIAESDRPAIGAALVQAAASLSAELGELPTSPLDTSLSSALEELNRMLLAAAPQSCTRIDDDQAIAVAKTAAAQAGFIWIEPTEVNRRSTDIQVRSHANALGGNVVVLIDAATGDVRQVLWFGR